MNNDIYTTITNQIIQDLERGELTWRKPWSDQNLAGRVTRPLRWNNIPYTGINTIMLWSTATGRGYTSPYWMTFKQAIDLKAHIRKGETGTHVVYADRFEKKETKPDGTQDIQKIPFLKLYTVFNASQIEGLPATFYPKHAAPEIEPPEKRIESLETFFSQTGAEVYQGIKAAYSEATDRIEMPPFACFHSPEDYYSTLAHEVTHWTKHPTRLNRDFNRKRFGDEGYAKEELVAELGSCFLAADLGFAPKTLEEHAAYIQSWLQVLQNDKRFIFQAAAHAQKAVEYLGSLQSTSQIQA
jgi:antirestriction protein ArdC